MEIKYDRLNDKNIAPYLSEFIIVKNEDGDIVGKIPLDNYKPEYGKRLYRFAALSDIHFNENEGIGTEGVFTNKEDAILDFKRAVRFISNSPENEIDNIEFVCISGDICEYLLSTNVSNNKDLDDYKSIREEFESETGKKIYTCTGNHDTNDIHRLSDLEMKSALSHWYDCTGMKNTKSFSVTHTTDSGKEIIDNFYFLSMTKFNLGSQGNPFIKTDITSLETFLSSHNKENERTFVFTHAPFPMRAGLFAHKYNNGRYWYGGKWLKKLTDLTYKYKNAIWFSGHSHYEWGCQGIKKDKVTYYQENEASNWKEYNKDANIWPVNQDHERECAWCVHVPSCSGVRPYENAFGTKNWKIYNTSEFAIIDVYENYIDFRGVSLVGQKRTDEPGELYYNPIAQYRLDTTYKEPDSESYDLVSLTVDDLNNMEIGSSKEICMTSTAYNMFHIGSIDNECKFAAIYDSFSTPGADKDGVVKPYNDPTTFTGSDVTKTAHTNHEWQMYAEMRDLVNMRPKQFTFTISRDEDGFTFTNKSGYSLNEDLEFDKDTSYHFDITGNDNSYPSSSCLFLQEENTKIIRIKKDDKYIEIGNNSFKLTSNNSGWSYFYIYEVIRKKGNEIDINTLN